MKKAIPLIMMLMLFALPLAYAMDEMEQGADYNGAPTWDYYKSQLSWKDRLTSGTQLAVVGGAQCASSASYSSSGVTNADNLCWDNKNGGSPAGSGVVHRGVVYQIFFADDNKFSKVGEVNVEANTKGCVPVPTKGKNYYRQAFYCDDTSKTCTEYKSVCNTQTGVVRERTCLFNDGRNVKETVTDPNWKDPKVGTCPSSTNTGTTLPSNQQSSGAGDSGSGGGTTTQEISGSFRDTIVPDNAQKGEEFPISTVFKADVAGRYYLEAYVFDKLLAVTSEPGSKCDGSLQASGDFIDLKAGEEVLWTFKVIAPSSEGKKTIVVGAYTGCLSQGGKQVASDADDIQILGPQDASDGNGSSISLTLWDWAIIIILGVVGVLMTVSLFPPFGMIAGGIIGAALGYGIVMFL